MPVSAGSAFSVFIVELHRAGIRDLLTEYVDFITTINTLITAGSFQGLAPSLPWFFLGDERGRPKSSNRWQAVANRCAAHAAVPSHIDDEDRE